MKVNGIKVEGISVAHEGCHKIYICEDEQDEEMMRSYGYEIYPLSELPAIYENACSLRFIDNAKLTKVYAPQCEDAIIEV